MNWQHAFRQTVRSHSIVMETWDTPDTFQRVYKATRVVGEEQRWLKYSIDYSELARIPREYVEMEVHKMTESLFQDIVELPWETYFDPIRPVWIDKIIDQEFRRRKKEEDEWRNV
jgi:hypothetical protein